jgi:hypothetical protein
MRKVSTVQWMGAALAVALAIAATVYVVAAPPQRLGMALRATARWSFLWFCLATYGGALTALFGARFQPLARSAREFGLAFASAQSVHVALALGLLYTSPDPFPRLSLVVFTIGVCSTYLLAALSLNAKLRELLGPSGWKSVRSIGVEYIAFAYAFEFGGRILGGNRANALHYLPLFAAAVGGPMLRVGAALRRRFKVDNTAVQLLD